MSRRLVLFSLALGSIAIASASRVYFDDAEVAPFILEKLPLRFEAATQPTCAPGSEHWHVP